jgi:hypothetical protein
MRANGFRQAFANVGINYRQAIMDKAVALAELEPLFAEGRIDLLDHPQLVKELKCLERRLRTGGRVFVDHPHGGHDDHATALALAAMECRQAPTSTVTAMEMLSFGHEEESDDVEPSFDRSAHRSKMLF